MMSDGWRFVVADALETVLPAVDPRPIARRAGRPWAGSTFLGETCSFQLAFVPPPEARVGSHAVRIELGGSAAPYATLSAVDLVPVALAAFPDHDEHYLLTEPGLYPDLLRPLPDRVVDPVVGHWRSVWFDLLVDPGAGLATGTSVDLELEITVRLVATGDRLFAGSVGVRVVTQQLPPLDLVNTQWLHTDCLVDHYGDTAFDEHHWAALDAFVASATRMNITGLLTPLWTPPLDTAVGRRRTAVQLIDVVRDDGVYRFGFDRLDRWLDLLRRHRITHLELSHLFTQWGAEATPAIDAVVDGTARQLFGWHVAATDPDYRDFLRAFLPALRRHLDGRWDPDKIIFHISDEPDRDHLESYRAARDLVADLLDGCLVVDALSDWDFYSRGVVDHPVVATDAVEPFLGAGLQRLWVYYCVGQHRLVANRFIGMPAARHRILGHQLFAANAGGFLHWGFNFYNARESVRRVDPFADTTAGGAFPGGDPFIVYPGPGRTVWESTRHRIAAQAFADHRAMQALRDRSGREAVLDLVDPDRSLTFSDYPRSAQHLLDVRERINAAICAFDDAGT